MPPRLTQSTTRLRRRMKTDPDPRVRRRAHAVLLVAEGTPVLQAARLFQTAAHRIRAWLQKNAPAVLAGFDRAAGTSVRSTSSHGWRRSGRSGAAR